MIANGKTNRNTPNSRTNIAIDRRPMIAPMIDVSRIMPSGHARKKAHSPCAQQRIQYRFIDLGGPEICREGRDTQFAAGRYLSVGTGGMCWTMIEVGSSLSAFASAARSGYTPWQWVHTVRIPSR